MKTYPSLSGPNNSKSFSKPYGVSHSALGLYKICNCQIFLSGSNNLLPMNTIFFWKHLLDPSLDNLGTVNWEKRCQTIRSKSHIREILERIKSDNNSLIPKPHTSPDCAPCNTLSYTGVQIVSKCSKNRGENDILSHIISPSATIGKLVKEKFRIERYRTSSRAIIDMFSKQHAWRWPAMNHRRVLKVDGGSDGG